MLVNFITTSDWRLFEINKKGRAIIDPALNVWNKKKIPLPFPCDRFVTGETKNMTFVCTGNTPAPDPVAIVIKIPHSASLWINTPIPVSNYWHISGKTEVRITFVCRTATLRSATVVIKILRYFQDEGTLDWEEWNAQSLGVWI